MGVALVGIIGKVDGEHFTTWGYDWGTKPESGSSRLGKIFVCQFWSVLH